MKKPADKGTLSADEGEALMARVHQSTLGAQDARSVEWMSRRYCWVALTLQEANRSVQRLRNLFCGRGHQVKRPPAPEVSSPSSAALGEGGGGGESVPVEEEAAGPLAVAAAEAASASPAKAKGGHRAGTGRLSADAYAGAARVACRHEELAVGQRCPVCGHGNLSELPAGVEMRSDGHAWRSAVHDEGDQLRCSACGEICTAGLPDGVGEEQDSAPARAVLAVSRYDLGVPGSRWPGSQAMLGVPGADATQWDQIEVVGDGASKVCEQLAREAAQGERIFQDDTAVRIVSLSKETRGILAAAQAPGVSTPHARPGMHTTALAVQVGEHPAMLYDSSRRQAGENLQGLLDKREAGRAKPLAMSDALWSNEVADASMRIRCHGLAHGRRQCSDVAAVCPHACQVVLQVISQVFDHDEQARTAQRSAAARLADHQAQSQPLLDERTRWLAQQLNDHLVEPNSALGKASGSRQGHWTTPWPSGP